MPYDYVGSAAVPRAGSVVAYFAVGDYFKEVGSYDEARRFLTLAAEAPPDNETDRLALPLVLSTLIGMLGSSEGDKAEIQIRLRQLFASPREIEMEPVFARFVLGDDGESSSALTDGGRRLRLLISGLEQEVTDAQPTSDFWRAEILAGRARLDEAAGVDRGRIVWLWREAMGKAVASQNARILFQAGHALGFEYVEYSSSCRELARYQFECLRGAELRGISVEVLGVNLFRRWRRLEYRRL